MIIFHHVREAQFPIRRWAHKCCSVDHPPFQCGEDFATRHGDDRNPCFLVNLRRQSTLAHLQPFEVGPGLNGFLEPAEGFGSDDVRRKHHNFHLYHIAIELPVEF